MKRQALKIALVVMAVSVSVLVAAVGWEMRGESLPKVDRLAGAAVPDRAQIERGAYLARAGNCMACHTVRGDAPFAGGRAIDTPFGTVVAGNLTPDVGTGLGAWSAQAFRRALHEGRSRDGRLLYPVFPYTHTTLVSEEDSDALYAFLRSVPAVEKANAPHQLGWPANNPMALAAWRLLYFKPGRFQPEAQQSAEWNRGAYLARGLAHCSACHSARDALGGNSFGRGLWEAGAMPDGHWLAPSLRDVAQAGVASWSTEQVADFLQHGRNEKASALGPMGEVVFEGTQYLKREDLTSIAIFLKTLPEKTEPAPPFERAQYEQLALGQRLYEQQCVDCHGAAGQGAAGAYPPLAGNRTVLMGSPVNVVQSVFSGGFAPATPGNPQPYGMPPFRTILTDVEVAAVSSFVRQSWGNQASAVSALEVQRLR